MPPPLAARKRHARVVRDTLAKLYPEQLTTPLYHSSDWELLVAVILSAQCTDARVNTVTPKLFKKYKTMRTFADADIHDLENAIKSTGFFRSKAKAIQGTARMLLERHGGKIPDTMQELLQLPGVGRKTANVILGHVHNTVEGIAVDTHVKRLAKKFGLTEHDDPDKIEQDLLQLLPQKDWWNFGYRLKAYGREYSPAHKKYDITDPISKRLK